MTEQCSDSALAPEGQRPDSASAPSGQRPDIELPRPHAKQWEALNSPKRYKILNWGGRTGKSRVCLIAGTLGHGVRQPDGTPQYRGAAQGAVIAWVAPTPKQARAIWQEEIVPRFGDKDAYGVVIRESDAQVCFPGGGLIEIRSAAAIDGLRGRRWDGVIFDEARDYDLRYAWEEVVSLRLIDSGGWAIFPSTPNGGRDGNPDHIIPSYFNRLCEQALTGTLDAERWGYWHATMRENPYLPQEEVEYEYRVTPPTGMKRRQEMDAELVVGGGGLAFPEWTPAVHLTTRYPDEVLRKEWTWAAGLTA